MRDKKIFTVKEYIKSCVSAREKAREKSPKDILCEDDLISNRKIKDEVLTKLVI